MIRDLLTKNQPVPELCMRADISNWLLEKKSAGHPLFVEA
jgi:hypothetical protein